MNARRLECMEVWGGNQAVDGGVVMAGLDAWVYSAPYRGEERGGDVYYVSSCATGRITRLLVADVSGHGAAVASTASALRRLMRRFVNHIDQRRFMLGLNRAFGLLADDGGFATAVAGTFFAPTNTLSLSSAGHPPPLVHRAKRGAWAILDPVDAPDRARARRASPAAARDGGRAPLANIPLGVERLSTYDERGVQLRVGDLVLFYTDSASEARRADGRMLGPAGLLELARDIDVAEPARVIPALRAAIATLAPGNLTGDDVTFLLIRPNGLAARVPLRDRLAAPLRILRHPNAWPEMTVPAIGGAMLSALNRRWTGRSLDRD